ncbi:MAG TPA: hypothetical protein VF494_12865 [Candidatus Limnocylindrales bacterium]
MTTPSRWFVPALGFVLGILIAAAEMDRSASPWQAALAFAIVAGYALALRALQSRSDMASLLSGLPTDERWASINVRALSLAGQVMAIVLVTAFVVTQFGGGDATTYAQLGAVFGVAYLVGLAWYRVRS